MKKIAYLLSAFCALFVYACSNGSDEPIVPMEKATATFVLDYTFESGDMSRSNEDVYDNFYEANIKTKLLIVDDYKIEFTDKTSGVSHVFTGKWSNGDKIKLPVGEYKVKGASVLDKMCYKKASIGFEKDIEIKKDTKQVVLDANYKCCLIMFEKSNIKNIEFRWMSDIEYLELLDGYFYCFCKNMSGTPYFKIERDNGSGYDFKINISDYEDGKYYIFNDDDEASTFNLPKMEAGN